MIPIFHQLQDRVKPRFPTSQYCILATKRNYGCFFVSFLSLKFWI